MCDFIYHFDYVFNILSVAYCSMLVRGGASLFRMWWQKRSGALARSNLLAKLVPCLKEAGELQIDSMCYSRRCSELMV